MYRLSTRSRKKLIGVHPFLSFAVEKAIEICEVDFGVIEGVRSFQRQKSLVKQGRSKTFNSYHLYGLAVDLVPWIDGNFRWDDDEAFKKIAKAMKEVIDRYKLPIEWGYELWGWDKPHWQMSGWRGKYDVRKIARVSRCINS